MRFYFFGIFIFLHGICFAQVQLSVDTFDLATLYRPVQEHIISAHLGANLCKPDSILHYAFSSPTDSVLTSKIIWRYYGDEILVSQESAAPSWKPTNLDSAVYDELGRLLLITYSKYDSISNQFFRTNEIELYPHGDKIKYDSTIFRIGYSPNELTPNIKVAYIYDNNDFLIEEQHFAWQYWGLPWKPSYTITYNNAPNGKVMDNKVKIWQDSVWTDIYSNIYTYDSNDSLSVLVQTYVPTNTPTYKWEYYYPTPNILKILNRYQWDTTIQNWIADGYELYEIDAQNRQVRIDLVEGFFNGRNDYFYVENTNCYHLLQRSSTEDEGLTFDLSSRDYYYYSFSVATQTPVDNLTVWSAYPNPTIDGIWIEAPPGNNLQVIDLQGKIIYADLTKGKQWLDLKSLHGLYLLRLFNSGGSSTRLIHINP